ncbi:MAG: hypothetical protein BWY21_00367 [Parcubacteria group bacterium ADurb.Bin216]|nr:MAG: hypothetical protein BWY21_00367 [Parcubacteria group bacterium ADurb.Bin216]
MNYSENTVREITKYIVRLVKRQPSWLRALFEDESVCFVVDDDGSLALSVSQDLAKDVTHNVVKLVSKYMEKHPNKALKKLVVN